MTTNPLIGVSPAVHSALMEVAHDLTRHGINVALSADTDASKITAELLMRARKIDGVPDVFREAENDQAAYMLLEFFRTVTTQRY